MTIRAPHFSKHLPRKVQAPQVIPSLLLTTLALPFFVSEQTVPQTQITQQPLQLGMPLAILEDAGEKPFNQTEWPNPTLATHVQIPFQLSTLIEVGDPFRQTEWLNPTVEVLIQTPFQVGSSLNLIEIGGEKPFAQYDWLNPTLPPIPITQQVGSSVDLLAAVVLKPFNQLDWPNPTITPEPISFQVGSSVDLLTFISVRITAIQLSMSANEILLREEQPNIRLEQIASKAVLRGEQPSIRLKQILSKIVFRE